MENRKTNNYSGSKIINKITTTYIVLSKIIDNVGRQVMIELQDQNGNITKYEKGNNTESNHLSATISWPLGATITAEEDIHVRGDSSWRTIAGAVISGAKTYEMEKYIPISGEYEIIGLVRVNLSEKISKNKVQTKIARMGVIEKDGKKYLVNEIYAKDLGKLVNVDEKYIYEY